MEQRNCENCGNPFDGSESKRFCSRNCQVKAYRSSELVAPEIESGDWKQSIRTHIFVPDTQVEPGRPTIHIEWIGQFIHDEYADSNVEIIVGGDWWNMGSLSSYDRRGGHKMEGRRYVKDVDSGNDAWEKFNAPIRNDNFGRRYLRGNHEQRIERVWMEDASQEGLVGYHHLAVDQDPQWTVHEFLVPITIDGVTYSHYFVNPSTGKPLGGASLETRLKQVGHSFTMGHQQGLKWCRIDTIRGAKIGLAAGSCYIHDEEYMTAQVTTYWRGIVVCHQVEKGEYDPMMVSLDYLARRYEGKRLSAVKWRK